MSTWPTWAVPEIDTLLAVGAVGGGGAARTLKPVGSERTLGSATLFSLVSSIPGHGKLPIPATSKNSKLADGAVMFTNFRVNVSEDVTGIVAGKSMCTTGKGGVDSVPGSTVETPLATATTGAVKPVPRRNSASKTKVPVLLPAIRTSTASKLSSTVNLMPRRSARSPPKPTAGHSRIATPWAKACPVKSADPNAPTRNTIEILLRIINYLL